jgi:Ni,Fe-hydrogenase III large subunit
MQDIKDMTLREIESLQSQYKKEFIEVVEKFLEERPMIERVWLFEGGILTTHSASLRVGNIHNIVSKVYLKGVKL